MRLLILGGRGMLGHVLWRHCRGRFDTFVTIRHEPAPRAGPGALDPDRAIEGVDAGTFTGVVHALERSAPDVVVNCVGVVKRHPEAPDPVACIGVNALFPHRLAAVCARQGVRLIQLSTDCVFSGRRGGYREGDPPDPEDLYGRSKLLGELDRPGCLTLRTSMIGRELGRQRGLLEWFLAQRGTAVRGFRRAIFTGLTTAALSRILVRVIAEHPGLAGIWHVGSEPISKHDLLVGVRDGAGLDIRIAPDDTYACDRSLDSTRFRRATGITPPSWVEMLDELCAELRAAGGGRHAD